MSPTVKWVVELGEVEEASILGVADLEYWKDHLRQADLVPAERDGKAQILIVAAAARFAGLGFRELSFSVLVSQPGQRIWRESGYLIQAINSRRLLAFCERAFFSTPYAHGDVRLASALPAVIEWVENGRVLFRAQMQAGASAASREPSTCGEDGWEGAVFLPDQRGHDDNRRRMFFARIKGYTKRYPFLGDLDTLTVEPSPNAHVLQALVDSHFAPMEWMLRQKALHAKSKVCPPYLSPAQWAELPQTITVRILRFRIASKGFRTRLITLVTTLLDAQLYPLETLADLYARRWRLELCFRDLKTQMGMEQLRCQTPEMVEKEALAYLVAHNLVRCVMAEAVATYQVELERLSFKGTVDSLRQFTNTMAQARGQKTRRQLWDDLLWTIARDLVPLRPGWQEPRAVKHRPKPFPLLTRPRHLFQDRIPYSRWLRRKSASKNRCLI